MLGKDGQQKGTDLREKRKTRLPFSPSPFWKPFNGNTQSPRSGSFIFKMAAMLQIPRVFPRVSCRGSAKAVQCPCPGPKIGDKSQQIPRYSPVCPRGHPPGMAADKCITHTNNTDTKTFMAVQKSILEMEVHVVSFMMGKMNSDYV